MICIALIAARGRCRWIYVQQRFFLSCCLSKYFERQSGGQGGWRKSSAFKHCFAKGLFGSCLPNELPRSFLDVLFKWNVCLLLAFSKTSIWVSFFFLLVPVFSSLVCISPLICPSARQEISISTDNGGTAWMIHRVNNETNKRLQSPSRL